MIIATLAGLRQSWCNREPSVAVGNGWVVDRLIGKAMSLAEIILMFIIVWFTNYHDCTAEEIARIADEYEPRYIDIETFADVPYLLGDLRAEVAKCEGSDRPQA